MPQDLPGFYYDAEKCRYFPIKSPIPGSSSRNNSSASTSAQKLPPKPNNKTKRGERGMTAKVVKMLHVRELSGNSINVNKKKVNFHEQYLKIQTSKPIIWKYEGTQRIADAALEHTSLNFQTPYGITETEVLLTGGLNGTFCCCEVGSTEGHAINGLRCMPNLVHPLNIEKETESLMEPGPIWRPIGALVQMPSNVSCIKLPRKYHSNSSPSHALITTLGSETSGGSIYSMNINEPLEYNFGVAILSRRIDEISRFKSTIWTADSDSNRNQAVIGTNIGAVLVHIESGRKTWICRSKSDVLSLQFDSSGNNVLCGLRNGSIVSIDTRQKPQDLHDNTSTSTTLPRHQIFYPSRGKRDQKREIPGFELRGNIHQSRTIFMPSSVSCLVGLKVYEDYFLASSMDGTIRLYDHRLSGRGGVVQFYEGHVNSHTRIQIGVDPSERYFMSGGENCGLGIWSIKSGEMLFENKLMNSVASSVCWPRPRRFGNQFGGAWLGSQEGLFYVNNNS